MNRNYGMVLLASVAILLFDLFLLDQSIIYEPYSFTQYIEVRANRTGDPATKFVNKSAFFVCLYLIFVAMLLPSYFERIDRDSLGRIYRVGTAYWIEIVVILVYILGKWASVMDKFAWWKILLLILGIYKVKPVRRLLGIEKETIDILASFYFSYFIIKSVDTVIFIIPDLWVLGYLVLLGKFVVSPILWIWLLYSVWEKCSMNTNPSKDTNIIRLMMSILFVMLFELSLHFGYYFNIMSSSDENSSFVLQVVEFFWVFWFMYFAITIGKALSVRYQAYSRANAIIKPNKPLNLRILRLPSINEIRNSMHSLFSLFLLGQVLFWFWILVSFLNYVLMNPQDITWSYLMQIPNFYLLIAVVTSLACNFASENDDMRDEVRIGHFYSIFILLIWLIAIYITILVPLYSLYILVVALYFNSWENKANENKITLLRIILIICLMLSNYLYFEFLPIMYEVIDKLYYFLVFVMLVYLFLRITNLGYDHHKTRTIIYDMAILVSAYWQSIKLELFDFRILSIYVVSYLGLIVIKMYYYKIQVVVDQTTHPLPD